MAKGRLTFIAAMLALFAVLVLAACGGDNSSGGSSGNSGANAGKSNGDLVKDALNNSKTIKSYHTDMNITQAGQVITVTGDVDVANKNYKLNVDAAGFKISEIKTGSDSYVSMDGGTTWTKSDPSQQTVSFDSMLDMFKDAKPDEVDKVKDKLKDGTPANETLDGTNTKHITADAKDLSAIGANTGVSAQGTPTATEGTMDMWVSTNDKPVFYRIKMDGTSDGQPIKAEINWTKIDQPVTIEAPKTTP